MAGFLDLQDPAMSLSSSMWNNDTETMRLFGPILIPLAGDVDGNTPPGDDNAVFQVGVLERMDFGDLPYGTFHPVMNEHYTTARADDTQTTGEDHPPPTYEGLRMIMEILANAERSKAQTSGDQQPCEQPQQPAPQPSPQPAPQPAQQLAQHDPHPRCNEVEPLNTSNDGTPVSQTDHSRADESKRKATQGLLDEMASRSSPRKPKSPTPRRPRRSKKSRPASDSFVFLSQGLASRSHPYYGVRPSSNVAGSSGSKKHYRTTSLPIPTVDFEGLPEPGTQHEFQLEESTDTGIAALLQVLNDAQAQEQDRFSTPPEPATPSNSEVVLDLNNETVVADMWAMWENLSPQEREEAARKCYSGDHSAMPSIALPGSSTIGIPSTDSSSSTSPLAALTSGVPHASVSGRNPPATKNIQTPGCTTMDFSVTHVLCAWLDDQHNKCNMEVEANSAAILAHIQGHHAPPGVIVDLHKDFRCRWGVCKRKASERSTVGDHVMKVHAKSDAPRRVCADKKCLTYLKAFESVECAVCRFWKSQDRQEGVPLF